MAYVTEASVGGMRFSAGKRSSGRSERSGLSFPAAAAITGVGAFAAIWVAFSLSAHHSVTLPGNSRFDSIALTTPADRERFQSQSVARVFRPEKTSRLYPMNSGIVVSHAAKQYQIPPREAVASVNVPLGLAANSSLIAQALPQPSPQALSQPSDETKTGSVPPATEVASADDSTQNRFSLVMQEPGFEAPLPMARPEGWPKAPATRSIDTAPRQALAYASPDVDNKEMGLPPKAAVAPKMQAGVAIYDISAKTVFLPDGTRMEAHSGLGDFRDNPKYINVKGKGPTPPNTYKLSMRETPFHGVPALRMTPQDRTRMHGRDGILAHTYLRRRPGDSAGCIAFKDYYKFLKYYKRGDVHTIVVVDSMRGAEPQKRSTLASLFGG